MVSKEIEESVLNYIEVNRGLVTKNNVVKHVHGELSKPSTLKLLDKLESEGKINVRRGRKGERHYLSINDQNRSNQIKQQLSSLENFFKVINRYLQRRNDENYKDVLLKENEENEMAEKLDNRMVFVDRLYHYYYDTFRRILDNLFYVTTTSDLSKEDSEKFLKKIIELRSQLKYVQWSKDDAKKQLKGDISRVNSLIRRFQKSGLEDYIEEKQIRDKFAEPLILKINDFIVQFLD